MAAANGKRDEVQPNRLPPVQPAIPRFVPEENLARLFRADAERRGGVELNAAAPHRRGGDDRRALLWDRAIAVATWLFIESLKMLCLSLLLSNNPRHALHLFPSFMFVRCLIQAVSMFQVNVHRPDAGGAAAANAGGGTVGAGGAAAPPPVSVWRNRRRRAALCFSSFFVSVFPSWRVQQLDDELRAEGLAIAGV